MLTFRSLSCSQKTIMKTVTSFSQVFQFNIYLTACSDARPKPHNKPNKIQNSRKPGLDFKNRL